LQDVAHTAPSGGGTLTLQLAGSATQFENLTSYGVINVSDMTISLPTVGVGAGESEEMIRAQGTCISSALAAARQARPACSTPTTDLHSA